MDVVLVEFDSLRRRAESRMRMVGALSGAFVSALRMQVAALSRSGRSPAMAGVQGNLGFQAVARREVLASADVDVPSDDNADFEV